MNESQQWNMSHREHAMWRVWQHTHKWVIVHTWIGHMTLWARKCARMSHMNESWHTCEWVMVHMWISHGTQWFFGVCSESIVTLGKRWGPEPLWFFTLEKHSTKSHLPKLIFRAGRSDTGGPERVSAPSNAEMKLHGVSSTGRVLKFAYVFVHAVGGAAPLHSPRKPLRQRQPKTGSDG